MEFEITLICDVVIRIWRFFLLALSPFIMHSLRAGTKGYFEWIDHEWKHRWIFVIEEVWTMAEWGHCRRRKIAAAATLLMPGKAARGLVQLHKLRPTVQTGRVTMSIVPGHIFREQNTPRFPPTKNKNSNSRKLMYAL